MARSIEFIKRLENLNILAMVSEIASQKKESLADFNRWQLMDGKDRTGAYLPRYVDDPYFKTLEGALAYMDWKRGISLSDTKPDDVMDLRIRGDFHDSIGAEVHGNRIELFSHSHIAKDVQEKTGNKALGINPESASELWTYFFLPSLKKGIIALIF